MSSYGDHDAGYGGWEEPAPPASPAPGGYGRAQVQRDGYGYQYDGDDVPPRGSASPSYGRASGSASVGSASVGSAPVGRASVGRAGVPGPGGSGRASVPSPGVGRATVRPAGLDDDDFEGPDGPGGPGGRGPGGPRGPKGGKPSGDKAKKAKRTKILIASFAAFLIIFGVGAIGGTYYFDSLKDILPDNIVTAQTTMIMAADGKTQIAQLGTENRINVPMESIPEQIREALIAGEDKDFFRHHGISYTGILRAAWNNLTSGDTQGASTITQQYVKLATEHSEISYARKLREAILARKLEDKYSKLQIMGFYLNTVDFGRGAIGVEKAAQAYFNKSAKDLTVPEAAVLGSVIKDPYAENGALSLYDPEAHPDTAQGRWNYVLTNMVDNGWLKQSDKDTMQMPKTRPSKGIVTTAEWGIKVNPGSPAGTATGNVVNYVYAELKEQGIDPKELKTGGYRVKTTIDPKAQKIVEKAARPDLKGSELEGRTIKKDKTGKIVQDLESGAVMINPENGRVLAYYGGLDGTGIDYAGVNTGANGLYGGHEPGSSMKIYTLAAALDAGASLQSRWKAMPFTTDDKLKVGNAGSPNTGCKDYCTLEYSLIKSYNVPFYWVARQIGPGKVVKMAHNAGVNTMWDNNGGAHDLSKEVQDDQDRTPFDRQVGFGQYGITVLDHASGVSTFANGGVYNRPHFVLSVEKKDPVTGQYKIVPGKGEKLDPKQTIKRQIANDVTAAMQKVFLGHSGWSSAQNGRPVASKTGTWEGSIVKNGKAVPSTENSHAWVVGFTKQVALAVWTGNAASQNPVDDPKTHSTILSGTAPYRIWRDILHDYSEGMPKEKLADASNVGDDDFPGANGVSPSPVEPSQPVQPSPGDCIPLINCPEESPGTGGGGGGPGGGGGHPSPSPSTIKPSRSKGTTG